MSADFACFSLYGQRWSIARHGHRGRHPLLLHHGLLGDGHVHPDWVSLADAHGVEMIVIERPGYGGTPPCGMRAIADWPGLVAPLLAQLGIAPRFDVHRTCRAWKPDATSLRCSQPTPARVEPSASGCLACDGPIRVTGDVASTTR